MSRMQRDKGRKAEAEVRRIYESHGFTVRGLEATGDHLVTGHGLIIHSEVKRQETLRLPLWCRQAYGECPTGAIPVVAFRKSREAWSAAAPEPAVGELLRGGSLRSGVHFSLVGAAGTWWARLPLELLLGALVLDARQLTLQEAL
jgi:hypothetical protein